MIITLISYTIHDAEGNLKEKGWLDAVQNPARILDEKRLRPGDVLVGAGHPTNGEAPFLSYKRAADKPNLATALKTLTDLGYEACISGGYICMKPAEAVRLALEE